MAAVGMLPSRHGLHTVSSSVPIIYSPNRVSHEDHHAGAIFNQSATSNTLLGNGCYDTSESLHNSNVFINGGFYSPDCERRNQTVPDILGQEYVDENGRCNKNRKVMKNNENSSENVASPYKIEKEVTSTEIMRITSIPTLLRPQTLIKLMRAKSESTSPILKEENKSNIEQSTNSFENTNVKFEFLPTFDASPKRGRYFNKMSALFKRRSKNSLSKLASQSLDELTRHITFRIDNTHLKRSESQESIHETSTSSIFHETKEHRVKSNLLHVNSNQKGENISKKHRKVSERIDNDNNDDEYMMKTYRNDDKKKICSSSNSGKSERDYSLIKRGFQQADTSDVTMVRMPSLRKRKVRVRLFNHFTTTRSPVEGAKDIYIIKEATHVQPMDSGETIVTDILSNSMFLFDSEGHAKVTFSMEPGSEPWALCFTSEGCLAVTLKRQGCVSMWTQSGEPVSEFGHNILISPTGVQCDHEGRFIVADEQANCVCVFNACGEFLTKFEASTDEGEAEVQNLPQPHKLRQSSSNSPQSFFNQPRYVCITKSGDYVITDSANHSVKIFDKSFKFRKQFGSYGRQDGNFKFPYGVTCDTENNLYIADHFNNRVSLFSPEGEFIEHVLTSQDGISRPKSLAVHHSLLYITHGDIRSSKVSVFKLNKEL